MSDNSKKYPRTIESKNSYLRIRAPEHLDIALEGLIRKVLKEQPKMDDIYAFAADYFDMLLKLREKSGLRKLSVQDICPHHNEEDAKEMIKLASTFTKRKKEPKATKTYRAVSLKYGDRKHEKKGVKVKEGDVKTPKNGEKFNTVLPIVNEHPELEDAKPAETVVKSDINDEKESELDFVVRPPPPLTGGKIIETREVILEEDVEDEENAKESGVGTVGDIDEIRDKIKMVENEIKSLEKRESETDEEGNPRVEISGVSSEVEEISKIEESVNAKSSAENDIKIREVTHEEEEKAKEKTQEVEAQKISDSIGGDAEEIEQVVEDVKTEAAEEGKNDETTTEEIQEAKIDSGVKQAEESTVVEETVALEKSTENDAVDKTPKEDGVQETLTLVPTVEQTEEPGAAEKTLEDEADMEVAIKGAEASDPHTEETAPVNEQSEARSGNHEETKTEEESAAEESVDTSAKGNTETEPSEEVDPEAVVQTRLVHSEQSRIAELLGADEPKDEITTESEKFLNLEKQFEEVQNVESAPDNADKVAEGDSVIITVPEEGKSVERGSAASEDKPTEGGESILLESVALAGGVGASAAILQDAKKELTDPHRNERNEAGDEPSTQELLSESEAAEEMTLTDEIQKFLDRERQLSSYDKEAEGQPRLKETPEAGEITDSLAGARLHRNEEPTGKTRSGPSDAEAEVDDHEREGSTTSDEIEFDVSPSKYSETEAGTHEENKVPAVELETDSASEPKIVLELNKSGSEDQGPSDEPKPDPSKEFLSVPAIVEEGYPGRNLSETAAESPSRSKRSIDEEPINAEDVTLDCANVGNEIIQTGEVQKVELIEGEEDILQVHLTTTIETVQESGDSLLVQMTSEIDPTVEVSVETKVESPVPGDKLRLIRAAIIIQNGFRRFRKRKVAGERLVVSTEEPDTSITSDGKTVTSMHTFLKDTLSRESESSFSSSATRIDKGRNLSRSATRTLLETHSLDPVRKITPLKTRSLSSVRYGVADFEVWNQLVKELEEAATKIQSNYRGYNTRKKLQRGNAIQSTTMTPEDSSATQEVLHRHTGEFHDSIVLPLSPE